MRRAVVTLALAACSAAPDSAWGTRADMPTGRLEPGVVELDGEVYVIGGWNQALAIVPDVAVYDPAADSWRIAAPLPRPLHHLNLTVADGRIFVLGGLAGESFTPVGESWAYDPVADGWTPLAPMPAGQERGAAAVAALGGIIYVAGGSQADAVALAATYDIAGDRWSDLAPLPQPIYHGVGAALAGRFYVVGGIGAMSDGARALTTVTAYDPAATAWVPHAFLPTARGGCAAGTIDGRLICAGGEADADVSAAVESYDPVADGWTRLEALPEKRGGTGGAVAGGVLYVPGGARRLVYEPLATLLAYSPP